MKQKSKTLTLPTAALKEVENEKKKNNKKALDLVWGLPMWTSVSPCGLRLFEGIKFYGLVLLRCVMRYVELCIIV